MSDIPECTCGNTPSNRIGQMIDQHNRLVYAFNMDCPVHGIGEAHYRPMREVGKRAWMPLMQAIIMNNHVDGMHVIQRSADGRTALMEWIEYEFFPETETKPSEPKSLWETLTPAQQMGIMVYEGPESLGKLNFKLSQNKDEKTS